MVADFEPALLKNVLFVHSVDRDLPLVIQLFDYPQALGNELYLGRSLNSNHL